MTDYGQTVPVTEDERKEILRKVAVGIHNVVSPETQDRRDAARKQELLQISQEHERNSRLSELQIQRQRNIDKEDAAAELRRRGWTKWGQPQPSQKFYNFAPCIWGCGTECAYIADVSPNVKPTDSKVLPYDKSKEDDHKSFPELHICNNLGPATAIISSLQNQIVDLKVEMVKRDEEIRNYAAWAGSGR